VALTTNLLEWWDLDEASGTRVGSHNGNNLSVTGTVNGVTGKVNSAADVSSGNYLSGSNLLSGAAAATIAGWVKFDTWAGFEQFYIAGDGALGSSPFAGFWLRTNGGAFQGLAQIGGSLYTPSASFSAVTGTWIFIALRYDGSAVSVSVNAGAATGSAGASGTISNPGSTFFQLGGAPIGTALDGQLDSWGVWDAGLSDADLTTLYNGGAGVQYSDIAAAAGQPAIRRYTGPNFRPVEIGRTGGQII
jgi:hypothetical protein